MSSADEQVAKMEANIAENTGKTVDQWVKAVQDSGLGKHGQIVKWLKTDHDFTHGYANLVAHRVRLESPDDVDAEVAGWLKAAFEAAG